MLIVDDIPANLVAIETALEPLGRPVIKASSGQQALAALLEDSCDELCLVLLDVHMPGMDGFETARLIRSRERTRHLPIIFLTAHDHEHEAVLRAYRLGAVDFLFKPIEPEILRAKASVFMTLQRRTEELAAERLQRELDRARRDYETETLRREMAQEHAAREELARLDHRKNCFLAILGHELRNPLAPLRTAIELLKRAPDRPVGARTLEVLDRQTAFLTRLVEDLLDVSRINANKIELRPERVDLRALVEAAIVTSRPGIEQRGHTLEVVLADGPVGVVVDQVRIVQVVTNLLNNAARYTDRGGRIRVECASADGRAIVRVSDTGIGIAPELLPKIFEMFVQERVRSDGSGGLGLGLALARQLVAMHDGTIAASSGGRGAGSTFEVALPLDRGEAQSVAPEASAAPRPAGALRALVIDDNADARDLLAELLKAHGHEVCVAEDGPQALALIKAQPPDVALVDLGLPGMDGLTLVQELRAQLPALRTRLVALTGYGDASDVQRTREAGFDAHLVKPASVSSILEALVARDANARSV
ncbi:MAG TPA: response regulator [Kofleriaceae bacterium]|nr:response regulator [Kofleriaceae bacterium]